VPGEWGNKAGGFVHMIPLLFDRVGVWSHAAGTLSDIPSRDLLAWVEFVRVQRAGYTHNTYLPNSPPKQFLYSIKSLNGTARSV